MVAACPCVGAGWGLSGGCLGAAARAGLYRLLGLISAFRLPPALL